MAKLSNYKTPGVYIEEVNNQPHSIPQVPTDIVGFVGYTEQAMLNGAPCFFQPVKINSLSDFERIFSNQQNLSLQTTQTLKYPHFYVSQISPSTIAIDAIDFNGEKISVQPDPATIYYLHQSVQLFFANGGKSAYIVSVGNYGKASNQPILPTAPLVNPNIQLADLERGLNSLATIKEVSLYAIPDASLLSRSNTGTLQQAMLNQCNTLGTVFSILDVPSGRNPKSNTWKNEITDFRSKIGINNLERGAAYFPFLKTNVNTANDLDYTQINNGQIDSIREILFSKRTDPMTRMKFKTLLKEKNQSAKEKNQTLLQISKPYRQLLEIIKKKINILPPSGAVAGAYARVDTQNGVWKAPANIVLLLTSGLTLSLNDQQQAGLNVDPFEGKSINAIRNFAGRGILLWGARTLAGNDNEWRYVPVRRLATLIEHSCQNALTSYVFEPNDTNTWLLVKATVENFLMNLWRQGAFQGATPDKAFFVKIGLNETMTAQDILEGRMIVEIGFAAVRPAEFIILKWTFKMQSS